MPQDDILLDCEEQMEKTVDHLRHELRGVRTGRATPALVESSCTGRADCARTAPAAMRTQDRSFTPTILLYRGDFDSSPIKPLHDCRGSD